MNVTIRLLETESNALGDRFAQLMVDLFLTLGYEECRWNIHRSGREIDLQADHRTEQRRAIVECKATAKPSGGDDLNKFAGVLDVERRKSSLPVQGYFISLNGFRETAHDQEAEAGGDRFVLLDGADVVRQLIQGHVLVDFPTASLLAGQCLPEGSPLKLAQAPELLAHESGWLWCLYFEEDHAASAFALIHADGGLLDPKVVRHVVQKDREAGGHLHELQYLSRPPAELAADKNEVKLRYLKYLEQEYGSIQIEGLPTDQHLGTRRLPLEELYTPLHLERMAPEPVASGNT